VSAVQSWATGWMIGVSNPGSGWEFFSSPPRQEWLWGPTQPPIQWVPGALSLGVKRPGREADHPPPSSAEVKNEWSYTSTPQYALMACCSVKKHRDNFTFIFAYLSLETRSDRPEPPPSFRSWSSGLWHRVVMWKDTIVSEGHAASIFRVKWRWR
jgi:hypothetical protein